MDAVDVVAVVQADVCVSKSKPRIPAVLTDRCVLGPFSGKVCDWDSKEDEGSASCLDSLRALRPVNVP